MGGSNWLVLLWRLCPAVPFCSLCLCVVLSKFIKQDDKENTDNDYNAMMNDIDDVDDDDGMITER